MKTKVLRTKKVKQYITILNNVLDTHEKYKKAYFWTPGRTASQRRYNEDKFPGWSGKLEIPGFGVIEIEQVYYETTGNCYYSSAYYLDGEPKDIRVIKKALFYLGNLKEKREKK